MSVYEHAFGSPIKGEILYFETLASLRTAAGMFEWCSATDGYTNGYSGPSDSFERASNFIADGFCYLDAQVLNLPTLWAPKLTVLMCRKFSLVLDRVSPAQFDNHDGTSRSAPREYDNTDALWIPFPISAHPRVAYYSEGITAERELSGMAADVLLAIQDGRESPVPDYLRAKELYHGLLQWKEARSECFLGQTCVIPAWMCLL